MGVGERAALRAAVLWMERYRSAIEAEVNRRMGRSDPTPDARAEIVRRFRTFCRLASIDLETARPSLDGLGGQSSAGLESAVQIAVHVACECGPPPDVAEALRDMGFRFRAGIRRIMQPKERPERRRRRGQRKLANAGKRVRAAIDRIPDAYIALNLDTGKIYDVNPAAETLLAVDAEGLLEKPLSNLIAMHQRAGYDDLELRLDAGEDCAPTNIVFARPNGDFITVEASIASHTIGGKRLAIFTARESLKQPA